MHGREARQPESSASPSRGRSAIALLILVLGLSGWHASAVAEGSDFLASDWGAGFLSCGGATKPVSFRAAGPESQVIANGIINCRDDGDALVYTVDYMNFLLSPTADWSSAGLQWFGAAAQRQGANGRNDWFYDEARPIKVQIAAAGKRVAISNVSFRVPKTVLKEARGFGFYAVGGGIFWPVLLQSRVEMSAVEHVETSAPATGGALPVPSASKVEIVNEPTNQPVAVERAEWGAGFPTCAGARSPVPFKAATSNNESLLGNGIITCVDAGDAYVYAVDYINFWIAAASRRSLETLEWFGCGAQRAGNGGRNEWIFDEAMPIAVKVKAGAARVAITQLSCRVPKVVLSRARGFGFYVVGGGTQWSILLL